MAGQCATKHPGHASGQTAAWHPNGMRRCERFAHCATAYPHACSVAAPRMVTRLRTNPAKPSHGIARAITTKAKHHQSHLVTASKPCDDSAITTALLHSLPSSLCTKRKQATGPTAGHIVFLQSPQDIVDKGHEIICLKISASCVPG